MSAYLILALLLAVWLVAGYLALRSRRVEVEYPPAEDPRIWQVYDWADDETVEEVNTNPDDPVARFHANRARLNLRRREDYR